MLIGYAYNKPLGLFDSPFPLLILLVSACSGVLAWWWAVGVNDLHDLETDKISNHSRPLVSGIISAGEYRILNLVFLLLSLAGAIVIRHPFLVPILVAMALSYIYSAPPLRLKRVPLLATFILALCSALVCLAGYILFSDDYSFIGFPPRILGAILVAFTLGLTVIDIKDLKGDRATGTLTLPILFGEKKGARITGGLMLLAYLGVPVILKTFVFIPLALLFGITTYFLVNRKPMREKPVFLLYYLFLGAIAIFVYSQICGG
jgi:4-hydroxybenzoate polyprenyltransferase